MSVAIIHGVRQTADAFFMPGILDSQTFSIFEFFENFVKFLNSAWTIKFQNFIEFLKFCRILIICAVHILDEILKLRAAINFICAVLHAARVTYLHRMDYPI